MTTERFTLRLLRKLHMGAVDVSAGGIVSCDADVAAQLVLDDIAVLVDPGDVRRLQAAVDDLDRRAA